MSDVTPNVPPALIARLHQMAGRFDAVRESLNDPAVLAIPQKTIALIKESGQLEAVVLGNLCKVVSLFDAVGKAHLQFPQTKDSRESFR